MKKLTDKPIGIVKNVAWFETDSKKSIFLDRWLGKLGMFFNTGLSLLFVRKNLDFLGVNYYFTNRFIKLRWKNPNDKVSDLGWRIRAEGLEHVLLYVKKFHLPIYITENGLADADDSRRKDFIHDHLVACWNAIQKGVDLRGYLHWSLIDNYEWHQGFWPRFGLVEIDRANNLQRKPRPSFYYYAGICKNNKV